MDFIQLNKFSNLHDGKKIIFCKTDYLEQEFEYIKNLDNDVILITGNSDYHIDLDRIKNLPNNIKVWYGQNICVNHDKIIPLPLGLENMLESSRFGHGIGYYDRVLEKERLINRKIIKNPIKNIYSNFQINTNYGHRTPIMQLCRNSNHIDWDEPNMSLENFFDKILDYKMVVCPAGNGVDTHRIWEVLYSNRIPITIKIGNFKIYELYENLPIIILNDTKDLMDNDLIQEKYNEIISKNFNMEFLSYNYWEQKILNIIL